MKGYKAELRLVLEETTALCVMMNGTTMMLQLPADNWDSLLMVFIWTSMDYCNEILICLTCITGALALSGGVYSSSELSIALSFVNCSGDEDNLLSCSLQMSSNCPSMESAAIICQGLSGLPFASDRYT